MGHFKYASQRATTRKERQIELGPIQTMYIFFFKTAEAAEPNGFPAVKLCGDEK